MFDENKFENISHLEFDRNLVQELFEQKTVMFSIGRAFFNDLRPMDQILEEVADEVNLRLEEMVKGANEVSVSNSLVSTQWLGK
mgnify:CR=1 FL=1